MQKIATKVFTYASVVFGVTGILMVLTTDPDQEPNIYLFKLMFISGLTILTSFALSVAGKYLGNKS